MQVTPSEQELIRQIFNRFFGTRKVQVFFYGSRVQGKARPNSDLDVLLAGELKPGDLPQLEELFEESNLPYRVDLLRKEDLTPEFANQIRQHLIPFVL